MTRPRPLFGTIYLGPLDGRRAAAAARRMMMMTIKMQGVFGARTGRATHAEDAHVTKAWRAKILMRWSA